MAEMDRKKVQNEDPDVSVSLEQMEYEAEPKKHPDQKGAIRKLEGLIELSVLTILYYIVWKYAYQGVIGSGYYNYRGKYLLSTIYFILVLILFYLGDSFKFGHRKLSEVLISQWISLLIVDLITYFQLCLIGNHMLNPLAMIILLIEDFWLALLCAYIYTKIYHNVYVPKDMLMVYGNENAINLKFKLEERSDKYRVTKILSYTDGEEAIIREIAGHDAVIINDVPAEIRNDILKYCYEKGIRTYVVPKISDIILQGGEAISLFDTPLYLIRGRGLSPLQRAIKRTFDLVLCCIALIPCLPIMAVVAICIKHEDGGPVFYRQERVKEGGEVFEVLKFRSMVVNANEIIHDGLAEEDDPRITKVGRKIRPIRLDEIPQILNIFKGDMSWVGPRPEQVGFTEQFIQEIPEYAFRTKVPAGLTGYAQVYGKYNTSPYDKLRFDLIYIENYSFVLDLKLILMTIQILFRKESTEGIDKVEELENKKHELLDEIKKYD